MTSPTTKPLTFTQRLRVMAAVGTSVEISPDDARQLARLMDANLSTAKAALIESRKTYAKARQTLADSEKNLVVALILYVSTAAIFIIGAFL